MLIAMLVPLTLFGLLETPETLRTLATRLRKVLQLYVIPYSLYNCFGQQQLRGSFATTETEHRVRV
jgi:hypothetical protein